MIRFIITWSIWLIFADKKRWKELLLVGIFAGYLGFSTDVIMLTSHYKLWQFVDSNHLWRAYLLDDIGTYLVVPYLFIQWFPIRKTFFRVIGYLFIWSMICFGIEFLHFKTGHIIYHHWWNLGCSYVADWVLFGLIFLFHKYFIKSQLTTNQENLSLKSALNNLHDIVFLLNLNGQIIQIYGKWLEKHNFTSEFFIGKNVIEVVGEMQKGIAKRISEKVFNGANEVYIWRYSSPNNQTYCDFQTSISPIRGASGQIIGAIGVSHEIHCGVAKQNGPTSFIPIQQ